MVTCGPWPEESVNAAREQTYSSGAFMFPVQMAEHTNLNRTSTKQPFRPPGIILRT